MSSDPIEVLRKDASALLRVAEGCNEIGVIQGKASTIAALCRAALASLSAPKGEVVVTRDEAGAIVAVTRQDAEGRILSVIAEAAPKRKAGDNMGADPGHVQGSEWVLVPREPTPEMHEAGHGASLGAGEPMHPDFIAVNRDIYAAMLAAAPRPECRYPDCGCRSTMGDAAATEVCPKPESAEAVLSDSDVICPACAHQFRAIPVRVQTLMLAAGFAPPFTAPPRPEASAPVGVECNCPGEGKTDPSLHAPNCPARLAQQPAAVDEAMVEQLAAGLEARGWDIDPDSNGSGLAELRDALTAALAAQQGGSDNDR